MASPASSPRLPSPPPIAEDQTLPTSPSVSLFEDHGNSGGALHHVQLDTGASRRIRPGTRAEDMAEGPPLVELADIDSAFPLTEHLKALHYHRTHPDDGTVHPVTQEMARELAQPPAGTSREIWLYELARFLIQKTNAIIVALFADSPPCSAQTCAEMRASEWQYLCAVHDPPKSCSAVDYCCHTLDWAANVLTSSKMFPSRLGLGSGPMVGGPDKVLQQQMKEITNVFRRVYRIYAHAWFQHREMFWKVESKTGLYVFFKMVCDVYGMIQPENYTIPSEAEGFEPPEEIKGSEKGVPKLLRRDPKPPVEEEPAGERVVAHGNTTKRHRHTKSDLSSSMQTIIQEEEEEEYEAQPSATVDPHGDSPPKAGIQRQSTILKAEPLDPEPGAVPDDSKDLPKIGIRRQDTERPPATAQATDQASSDAQSAQETIPEDDADETQITVVETEPSPEAEKSEQESSASAVVVDSGVPSDEAAKPNAHGKALEVERPADG